MVQVTKIILYSLFVGVYSVISNMTSFSNSCHSIKLIHYGVKSVQSALSDLLTTSATHGTFSRPSTKRGLILIGLELNTNARESFEHC